MLSPTTRPLLFLFPLILAGCFATTGPDRCDEVKACSVADGLGCCDGATVEVSVCEACPSGTVESYMCRTTGCGECEAPPVECRIDYGEGCCGDSVFARSCDVCPAGSIEASACTADFPTECSCPSTIGPFRPPGDGAPERDAIAPPANCVEDLGGGCCGSFVTADTACGCPPGTMYEYECGMMAAPGIIAPTECRVDLGAGCCGELVEANACTAECPAGSVPAISCGSLLEDMARPAPAPCFVQLDDGCCTDEIAEANACGVCPEGTTNFCPPECGI